jgi:TonB-linked SusC/RagA family outer membrane protein
MSMTRMATLALIVSLCWAGSLIAQDQTGRIAGRVLDTSSQQPLENVSLTVVDRALGAISGEDGSFLIRDVPVGTFQVRANLIGYGPVTQEVTVTANETATVNFSLQVQAVVMEDIVATGYGTQERATITGAVATLDGPQADVGVITNVNQMIDGRVSGVRVTPATGEPGSGQQIRIRGSNSIGASSDPLYVIDGIAVSNVQTEADGLGGEIGGTGALARSPLNMINPSDIETITILKDPAAAAIYGSRAANGVVLVTTKKGTAQKLTLEYDGYVSNATAASSLNLLNGDEYRQFVQDQIAAGNLPADRLESLGNANTDWENAITRSALIQNHNLAFSGGVEAARFRASLNFMDQDGILEGSGLQRVQGRLNGSFAAFDDWLQMDLFLTSSYTENQYVMFQNTGGFEGAILQNMVVFNPTSPVTVTDPETGEVSYYELGTGSQSVRNPVAIANQLQDEASTSRTLGSMNITVDLESSHSLSLNLTGGVDRSGSNRRTYLPNESPVGAQFGGLGFQQERDKTDLTFQGTVNWDQSFSGDEHVVNVVGGFENQNFDLKTFSAQGRGFPTDAFSFSNLAAGATRPIVDSREEEIKVLGAFARANYTYKGRYTVQGVFRYDGASNFAENNKWGAFPSFSASWRIAEEEFMADGPFSEFRLRGGWGVVGNPAIPAYSSLITLEPQTEGVFGTTSFTGVGASQNPNPDLKWERTESWGVGLDFGFVNNRISAVFDYYNKTTKDLLLTVDVPQPAPVSTRLENVGSVSNKGFEFSFDAIIVDDPSVTWSAGLRFDRNRNEVLSLGEQTFIRNGGVSGQGQSGQVSQRLIPGYPIGTFWGPEYVGVDGEGRQLFNDYDENGNLIGTTTQPSGDDFLVIGDANPDFGLGFNTTLNWGPLDAYMLLSGQFGQDVFNNTALVYSTKSNVLQNKNFIAAAIDDPIAIDDPAIFSDLWIEEGSFLRLQNITIGYTFRFSGSTLRAYVSGDNLFVITGYSGYDPEVYTASNASRDTDSNAVGLGRSSPGIDYLTYPKARTFLFGINFNI